MNLKCANDRIETCLERMYQVYSNSGRRYNYQQIKQVFEECPLIKNFWDIDEEQFYIENRVYRVRDYNEVISNQRLMGWAAKNKFVAYLMILPENKTLKVGQTNDLTNRCSTLRRQYGETIVCHFYIFHEREQAEIMESRMKLYFKRKQQFEYRPNDRFVNGFVSPADLRIFERMAEEIRGL